MAASELQRALGKLESLEVVPGAGAIIAEHCETIAAELGRAVLNDVPAFSASANPEILPELAQHAEEHVNEIKRLLSGARPREFEFVAAHARHRAAQHFPLEFVLHAYRCGHKVLSQWMREAVRGSLDKPGGIEQALTAIADFAIEYTDTVSTLATAEYVQETRRLAEAEGDRRTELLSVLLNGYDESDGRVARLLRRGGYLDQRQAFCVIAVHSVDPLEMENTARVGRIIDSLEGLLQGFPARCLSGVRDGQVVAVLSVTRRLSGWTAPGETLASQLRPLLRKAGNAVLIGISDDVPATARIPAAFVEARTALDYADVSDRVIHFSDIPVRRLMVRRARESGEHALPGWSEKLFSADDRAHGALLATLRAYADTDMNVVKAARTLAVHPNTIYSRMQRISELTGKNALAYHDLTELLLTADCRGQT